jgi:hypothetical protein
LVGHTLSIRNLVAFDESSCHTQSTYEKQEPIKSSLCGSEDWGDRASEVHVRDGPVPSTSVSLTHNRGSKLWH